MRNPFFKLPFYIITTILALSACDKEKVVPDNQIPYYGEVSTVVIENYVNRTFIDLIGREPLDTEMVSFTMFLQENQLSAASRDSMANTLQNDLTPREGEVSYNFAYHHWFYEKAKGRFFREKAADSDFLDQISQLESTIYKDSLSGDTSNAPFMRKEIEKLQFVLDCDDLYRNGEIIVPDIMGAMINNSIYDFLNMNTFNFINASFDHLFYRYPTTQEFNAAFNIIEYNEAGIFMGQNAENKDDYIAILKNSRELYNGIITWTYKTLLVREPTTGEMAAAMQDLYLTNDLKKLERQIITSDEYAQFKY